MRSKIRELTGASVLALLASSAWAQTIGYTGNVVDFTVSTTGIYDIVAAGAPGGSSGAAGGFGAVIGGDISLVAGETLEIAVGGVGSSSTTAGGGDGFGGGGGGGGGSFVVLMNGP